MNKYVIYSIILGFIGNILVWFQLNSQLRWPAIKDYILPLCLLGIPISYIFFKVTEFGYQGLGSLWAVRMVIYAVSYLVFPFLTYFILNEGLNTTTIISILLSIVILIINI